jgi:hypothetical protein
MDFLKGIIHSRFDFLKFLINTVLIGAEGIRSSKMLTHFLRAVFIRGSLFNVLREQQKTNACSGNQHPGQQWSTM